MHDCGMTGARFKSHHGQVYISQQSTAINSFGNGMQLHTRDGGHGWPAAKVGWLLLTAFSLHSSSKPRLVMLTASWNYYWYHYYTSIMTTTTDVTNNSWSTFYTKSVHHKKIINYLKTYCRTTLLYYKPMVSILLHIWLSTVITSVVAFTCTNQIMQMSVVNKGLPASLFFS